MNKNMSEELYLGVDGGGTRCRARLQDSNGRILGEGNGGPANIRLGIDLAWGNIMAAVRAALTDACLDEAVLVHTAVGLGLAGIVTAEDSDRVMAKARMFKSVTVSPDYHIACLGAFDGQDGGIQIAGTGSSGYALVGKVGHSLGGWGFLLNEKGSAASLGRDAIRAALEATAGLAIQTPFTNAVITHFGDPAAIVDWSESARPMDYGALSTLVFRYAKLKDPVAVTLVRHLASDCGRFILQLVQMGAPKVCLVGGIASQIKPWLQPAVVDCLTEPKGDALAGALMMARQHATAECGVEVDA